jgi:hypothetical protein
MADPFHQVFKSVLILTLGCAAAMAGVAFVSGDSPSPQMEKLFDAFLTGFKMGMGGILALLGSKG